MTAKRSPSSASASFPPGVEPIAKPDDPNHRTRFYRVSDYLKAIGVNVDRVKAVHFADKAARIASIEGSELRADKDRFVFDFLQTQTGMPMQAWKTTGLEKHGPQRRHLRREHLRQQDADRLTGTSTATSRTASACRSRGSRRAT